MSVSSQTRGSVVEQLIFCEKRIEELEDQNNELMYMLEQLADNYQYNCGFDKMYELAMSVVKKARDI
mgnify:CR=1 FL=1